MKDRSDASSKPVYSTDRGDLRSSSLPLPGSEVTTPPGERTLKMRLETKGRGGKSVTVVLGLRGAPDDLRDLSRNLKTACGSGGTLKLEGGEASLEIQGDHRIRVEAFLAKKGYRVVRAGG